MKSILSSAIAIVLITAFFGFAYPAVMTAFGQVAFSKQANGSLIKLNGKVVGSKLAAQAFTSPRYFHERPSATSPAYNAGGTTFANLGPTSSDLARNV
ncbi:MAG: potassium-transporting ATPase subunit C, partial [Gaiellaceae bacterium]